MVFYHDRRLFLAQNKIQDEEKVEEDEVEEEEEEEDEDDDDEAPGVPGEEEIEEQPPFNIEQYLKFSGEDARFSDFTFIIGHHHRKFHVEKGILIRHSPILKDMIVDIRTITLLDVEENTFQRFLEVIYGASHVINQENIEEVLKLVKRWQAPIARRICEAFVLTARFLDGRKKLELCVLYELNESGLKKLILQSYDSFDEIVELRSSEILSADAEMMGMLFDRAVELRGRVRALSPRQNPTSPPANPPPRAHIPPPEYQENFRETESPASNNDIEFAPAPPPYWELAQPVPPVDFIEIRRHLNVLLNDSERSMRRGDRVRAVFWMRNISDYLNIESERLLPEGHRRRRGRSTSSESSSSSSTSAMGSQDSGSQNQDQLWAEFRRARFRPASSLSPSGRRQRNRERRVGSRSRSPARSPNPFNDSVPIV